MSGLRIIPSLLDLVINKPILLHDPEIDPIIIKLSNHFNIEPESIVEFLEVSNINIEQLISVMDRMNVPIREREMEFMIGPEMILAMNGEDAIDRAYLKEQKKQPFKFKSPNWNF